MVDSLGQVVGPVLIGRSINTQVFLQLTDGLVSLQLAGNNQNDLAIVGADLYVSVRFEGADCTGRPYSNVFQNLWPLPAVYSGKIYYSPHPIETGVTTLSFLERRPTIVSQEDCDAVAGDVGTGLFVPPDGCCVTHEDLGPGNAYQLGVSDWTFVPPYHLEWR